MTDKVYNIQELKEALKEVKKQPKKRQLTKVAVIRELKPEIEKLLKDGYRMQDIVDSLNGKGFDITSTAFKTYWQRIRKEQAEGPTEKPKGKEAGKSDKVASVVEKMATAEPKQVKSFVDDDEKL